MRFEKEKEIENMKTVLLKEHLKDLVIGGNQKEALNILNNWSKKNDNKLKKPTSLPDRKIEK